MPMYEYQCQKCGLHFDVEQRMIDDPLKTHEGCGGDVVKVFSSAGIVLKGSGFYKTDARSGSASQKAGSKSESGNSSDSGEKKPSKSDSEAKKPSSDAKKSDTSAKSTTAPKDTK